MLRRVILKVVKGREVCTGEKKGATISRDSLIANGGQGRNRTNDTRIFSPLLYRLSYLAMRCSAGGGLWENGSRMQVRIIVGTGQPLCDVSQVTGNRPPSGQGAGGNGCGFRI